MVIVKYYLKKVILKMKTKQLVTFIQKVNLHITEIKLAVMGWGTTDNYIWIIDNSKSYRQEPIVGGTKKNEILNSA